MRRQPSYPLDLVPLDLQRESEVGFDLHCHTSRHSSSGASSSQSLPPSHVTRELAEGGREEKGTRIETRTEGEGGSTAEETRKAGNQLLGRKNAGTNLRSK